ncbi:MAG: hypothetical protein ISS36_00970 [Candidatus Aenigmarchaeota archaeon]|nr:hypothetical protein [Candidatus Aenigmarchaeota archaeon]
MTESENIKNKIYSIFSDVATSIGYSPLHGKIIGVLLVKNKSLSLQEIAEETGYSSSMISLSLDLLDVIGIIKRVKKTGDRKLYIKLSGDLLECLKKAIIIKLEKGIDTALSDFETERKKLNEKDPALKTIETLEREIKRMEKYVKLLSNIRLP